MTKSIFVVMEQSFEYTDEYYYSTGGGEPVKAFLDREGAQEHADDLTRNFVDSCDEHQLAEYFQGVDQGDWEECCEKARGSLDDRMAYAKEIGLDIFHVVEVKVEPSATLEEPTDFEFNE